jgi:hypothetical protein
MSTTATIATIWAAHGSKFITHKMLAACATVAAAAKYLNLIYKV